MSKYISQHSGMLTDVNLAKLEAILDEKPEYEKYKRYLIFELRASPVTSAMAYADIRMHSVRKYAIKHYGHTVTVKDAFDTVGGRSEKTDYQTRLRRITNVKSYLAGERPSIVMQRGRKKLPEKRYGCIHKRKPTSLYVCADCRELARLRKQERKAVSHI
jgi:hypothetical protein